AALTPPTVDAAASRAALLVQQLKRRAYGCAVRIEHRLPHDEVVAQGEGEADALGRAEDEIEPGQRLVAAVPPEPVAAPAAPARAPRADPRRRRRTPDTARPPPAPRPTWPGPPSAPSTPKSAAPRPAHTPSRSPRV